MLPGSFTCLLLEVANFSDFAAKNFAEALYFGIGKRAAGHFILAVRLGRGQADGRGPAAAFAGGEFHAQRAAENRAHRIFECAVLEIQAVGFRRRDIQIPAGNGNAGASPRRRPGGRGCFRAARRAAARADRRTSSAPALPFEAPKRWRPRTAVPDGRPISWRGPGRMARDPRAAAEPVPAVRATGGGVTRAAGACACGAGGRVAVRGAGPSPANACSMGSRRPACTRRTSPISK